MEDIQHLLSVVVIFAAAFIGFLFVRNLLVPKSFGRLGHYRADAVDEFALLPLIIPAVLLYLLPPWKKEERSKATAA